MSNQENSIPGVTPIENAFKMINSTRVHLPNIGEVELEKPPSTFIDANGETQYTFHFKDGRVIRSQVRSGLAPNSKRYCYYDNNYLELGALSDKKEVQRSIANLTHLLAQRTAESEISHRRAEQKDLCLRPFARLYDESFLAENPNKVLFSMGDKAIKVGDIICAFREYATSDDIERDMDGDTE